MSLGKLFCSFVFATLALVGQANASSSIQSISLATSPPGANSTIVTFVAHAIFSGALVFNGTGSNGSATLTIDGGSPIINVPPAGTYSAGDIVFPDVDVPVGTHTITVTYTGAGATFGTTATDSITYTAVDSTSLSQVQGVTGSVTRALALQSNVDIPDPTSNSGSNGASLKIGSDDLYWAEKQDLNSRLQSKFVGGEPGYMLAANETTQATSTQDSPTPMISGSTGVKGWNLWFKLNNNQYRSENYLSSGVATNSGSGIVAGATKKLSPKFQAGAIFGFATSAFKLETSNLKMDSVMNSVGAYISFLASEGVWFNLSSVLTQGNYDIEMNTAKASTKGSNLAVKASVKGDVKSGNMTVSPMMSINTTSVYTSGYTDSLGNKVESDSSRVSQASLGTRVSYKVEGETATYTPYFGMSGTNNQATVTLPDSGQLGANAGLDVASKGWLGSLSANCEGVNSSYKNWSMNLGLSIPY